MPGFTNLKNRRVNQIQAQAFKEDTDFLKEQFEKYANL